MSVDETAGIVDGMKTKWERLEEWIFDREDAVERRVIEKSAFTHADLADGLGLDSMEATYMIQSYLDAQRRSASTTLYVLKRKGRTTASVWSVGHRTVDAKLIGGTLFEDVVVKVKNSYGPDLKRLAARNPRAAKYAEAKIAAVVEGALVVLASAVDSIFDPDEDES